MALRFALRSGVVYATLFSEQQPTMDADSALSEGCRTPGTPHPRVERRVGLTPSGARIPYPPPIDCWADKRKRRRVVDASLVGCSRRSYLDVRMPVRAISSIHPNGLTIIRALWEDQAHFGGASGQRGASSPSGPIASVA